MKNKIIASILLTICIVSVPFAYAVPEFSFEFGTTGTGDDELDNPTDVLVNKNGKKIYVVDSDNHRISVFKNSGNDDFRFGSFCNIVAISDCNDNADGADNDGEGQFENPLSIARDALENIFVVDTDNKRIQVFDDDGTFKSKFGSSDSTLDEYLGSAKGIVIQESTKEIFVSNIDTDSISVFDSTESFAFKFNTFDGSDDFKNPTNMIIDNTSETLYVSDSGNNRIVIFELVTGTTCPSGTEKVVDGVCYVEKFGTRGTDDGEFNKPAGLAYDSKEDLLYVSDSGNDRIQIFEIVQGNTCPTGTDKIVNGVCFVEKLGTKGTGNSQFDAPIGIALDTARDLLLVADSDNDRIQVFTLNSEPVNSFPDRPDDFKATPISPTGIILSWVEPDMAKSTPAISGYKIEYRVGSGDYITATENTESTTTTFIHQGLDSDKTHSYRIYSINSEGTSTTSSSSSTKPKHTSTPTALTAIAIAPNLIKLSWLPPSDTFGQSITGYNILREVSEGVYDESIGNTNSETTTFIVTDLKTDKTYTYAVSANIGYAVTDESATATATPREDSVNVVDEPITATAVKTAKPSPPIKLTATVISSTQIDLKWSEPVKDGNTPITGYKLEVKRDSRAYTTLVADTNSTAKTYKHTDLITGSKYTYKVSAINIIDTSDTSNEISATPKSTDIEIKPIGKLSVDEGKLLLFTAKLVDNSISNVVFSLDKNPPEGAKIISSTGVFSWTPTNSDGGKTYTLDVVAKKNGVEDRETVSITVKDVASTQPAPPAEPKELGIASFVDKTKEAQSYVDRYNNEPTYMEWFDENFAEYDSIYHAVGLDEPVVEEKKVGICGPGTKLVDSKCTIVDIPSVKPWWQFW